MSGRCCGNRVGFPPDVMNLFPDGSSIHSFLLLDRMKHTQELYAYFLYLSQGYVFPRWLTPVSHIQRFDNKAIALRSLFYLERYLLQFPFH